jgi:DNA-binding GntR family transcriptional regulator
MTTEAHVEPTDPAIDGRAVINRRSSLSDDVFDAVMALIMNGEIPPGERVSIDALARQLDVSPTPVREALARLESDGLVVKRALQGYRTTPLLTLSEVHELFEMRHVLEPSAARLAAERADNDEVATIQAEADAPLSLVDGSHYDGYKALCQQDDRFHRCIAHASHNPMLAEAFGRMHAHLHLFRLYVPGAGTGPTLVEHHRIAEAIAASDGDRAAAAMASHLDSSQRRLVDGLRAADVARRAR